MFDGCFGSSFAVFYLIGIYLCLVCDWLSDGFGQLLICVVGCGLR